MPLQSYVSCTCESFNCKYNPDGSGQKLQTTQTATRHQRADELLVPQADALGQAYGLSEDLTIIDSLEHAGNAHQPPDDPGADFDNNSDHGNNDVGDADDNLGLGAQPHFPELNDLFERWDEPYPANDDPGAFSSDPDAKIFEHLGQLNLEDPVNSDEELGMPAEGNHNDEFCPNNDEQLNDINMVLFISQGANFDFSDIYEDADIHASPPPCMNDHPAVRNAYIWAFISAAFYNATHAAVYHDLKGKECLLDTAQQANPDIEYLGLDNFACTLPTLLKCLERALQCLFLRPGKWEQFQHWRGLEDKPGLVPPIPGQGYDLFPDPSKPILANQHRLTILLMVIPGPDEPSLEQMNYLIEPFVKSMLQLEKGVEFRVNGHEDPEVSHSHLYCNVSNLPSSHKTSGLQGHNSKFFMCLTCKKPFFSLSHPSCFDPKTFQYRDEWRYIKYSFCACTAGPPTAKDISDN
ncbi:uncharacterized protein BJ212DRAFT_1496180 [Suillus subaureus]|uniref:Uncharacterized protein n=1 Tax=Suillus subaureus TaxID=48587 RepID=A0A9P7JFH4_9AGAM|nr:uncharacterized protein BJ212DRAFT_1496180 [Suillus subaureus]KAG1819287.1 hypothetical protein BJ212DRAFT_1496180 [Suillus subaureus]